MPHYNLPHNHGQNIERVLDNMPSAEAFRIYLFVSAAWRFNTFKDFVALVPLRGMCMQHSGGC